MISKLTKHRIIFVLVSSLAFSGMELLLFTGRVDFWHRFFLYMAGLTFSNLWDAIFCKPLEWKDKYKND